MEKTHVFKVNPVPKPRMTQQDKWKKRPCVLRYRDFCDKLRELAANNYFLSEDDAAKPLQIRFFIPVPKSWSEKKKREKHLKPHDQTPDLDNQAKAFNDALWSDDRKVWSQDLRKYWINASHGYIAVTIVEPEAIPPQIIHQLELDSFITSL